MVATAAIIAVHQVKDLTIKNRRISEVKIHFDDNDDDG
jgi:hypothetical protein